MAKLRRRVLLKENCRADATRVVVLDISVETVRRGVANSKYSVHNRIQGRVTQCCPLVLARRS